jgi:hypothetical protein
VATRSRSALARRLEKSVGPLATATTARMDRDLAWYRELSAEDRSWIGLIAQNGIASFTTWFRDPQPVGTLAAAVFGHAPRALTRVISLHQTVELVRTTIDAVEEDVDRLLGPDDGAVVRDAMLRYSRDIAFAAAEVYARAAEVRGAWDARLEALAVDAVLRGEADEAVRSRASALGWHASHGICVVLGRTPEGVDGEVDSGHTPDAYGAVDELRRSARQAGADTLCAVQGDRLVVVLGGVEDLDKAGVSIADHFGPGPVVMGPLVPDLLVAARSARAAAAGLRAAAGWPGAPRPVAADDLLPERALSGDGTRPPPAGHRGVRTSGGGRHPAGHPRGLPRARRIDRGQCPLTLRACQHDPVPAAADRGSVRTLAGAPARRVHAARRLDTRPVARSRGRVNLPPLCRKPLNTRG